MTLYRKTIHTIKIFGVNFCILIFWTSFNVYGSQNYTFQIAVSKSPLNIYGLVKKNSITDSKKEIKGNDWYRFYSGNFKTYHEASLLAKNLFNKSGLTNVYIHKIENTSRNSYKDNNVKINNQSDNSFKNTDENIFAQNSSLNSKMQEEQISDTFKNDSTVRLNQQTINKNSENNLDADLDNFERDLTNYIPDFMMDIFNSYSKEKYDLKIVLLFLLIVFLFILNIINVLLILIYSNKTQNFSDRYHSEYKKIYESALMSYLLGERNWEQTLEKLKKHHLPQNREILSSILLNFHENLKGIAEQMIPEIFLKLDLHKDAMKEANSKRYYEKIAGLKKLTYLYPEGAMQIIPHLLNDNDDTVSAEAQTAYVRLNPETPFNFFNKLNRPFTRWTQITTFYIFLLHQRNIPTFASYLSSQNTNVRNFSLRMIIFFQQLENIHEVLNMTNCEEESTRYLAIKAINDLRLYDGKSLIKNNFRNETLKNKIEIIRAFSNIGDKEDFEFLKEIILMHNVSLTLEACRSLFNMGSEGIAKLKQFNEEMNGELELYIAHISDPRN